MIPEEELLERAMTEYPVTKKWKTEDWTVFEWDNCLYYVSNEENVPDWEVGDEVSAIDVLWNKTRQDGCKFEINKNNPVFEEGFKQGYEKGRADIVRDLTNKYIFGGRK